VIEHSVRMPLYRVKYIAWLALESLCRQKGIDFEWELIIAEEQNNDELFGKKAVKAYKARLQDVGCVRIKYISLKHWIPLADKMILLMQHTSPSSKAMMPHAADRYSSPDILRVQHDVFKNPRIEWFCTRPSTIFYDIETGCERVTPNPAKGSANCVRLDIARKVIHSKGQGRGVDKWFYNKCTEIVGRKLITFTDTETWKNSFATNGMNTCTLNRQRRMTHGHPKWSPVGFDWKKNIPADIMERLSGMKKLIPLHKTHWG